MISFKRKWSSQSPSCIICQGCIFYILFHAFLFYHPISGEVHIETQRPDCPKVCHACFAGLFFCQKGGLTQLPNRVPVSSVKASFSLHKFHSSILRRSNLTAFSSTGLKLERLWLINCSLTNLEFDTFADMRYLNHLDLSNNRLQELPSGVFSGLNLTQLNLNNNPGLHIVTHSFAGLSVEILSLEGCQLTTLQIEMFQPIQSSLHTLDLKKNFLTRLDTKFEGLFHRVETVNLSENPISCRCDMLWLQRVYRSKKQLADGKRPDFSLRPDEATFPKCFDPIYIRGSLLHQVSSEQLFCNGPTIKTIEILYQSFTEVTLRCHVQGSPEAHIYWYKDSTQNESVQSQSHLETLSSPLPSMAIVQLRRKDLHPHMNHLFESIQCLASDIEGTASSKVSFTWPIMISQSNNKSIGWSSDSKNFTFSLAKQYFLKEPYFSIVHIICAVFATMVTTLIFALILLRLIHRKFHIKSTWEKPGPLLNPTRSLHPSTRHIHSNTSSSTEAYPYESYSSPSHRKPFPGENFSKVVEQRAISPNRSYLDSSCDDIQYESVRLSQNALDKRERLIRETEPFHTKDYPHWNLIVPPPPPPATPNFISLPPPPSDVAPYSVTMISNRNLSDPNSIIN